MKSVDILYNSSENGVGIMCHGQSYIFPLQNATLILALQQFKFLTEEGAQIEHL